MATSIKLINDSEKHYKFWSADLENATVNTQWGRLGTKGQSKTFTFTTTHDAQDYYNQKIREKIKKNYYELDEKMFKLKQFQAELIGSECKIENLQFVELKTESNLIGHTVITILDQSVLSNPNCRPMIYCKLMIKDRTMLFLIDNDNIYNVIEYASIIYDTSKWPTNTIMITKMEKISNESINDKDVQKILNKIPQIIKAIFYT